MLTFEIYIDRLDEFRWRIKSSNGRIIADSGEGYVNKSDAIAMIEKIKRFARFADIIDNT